MSLEQGANDVARDSEQLRGLHLIAAAALVGLGYDQPLQIIEQRASRRFERAAQMLGNGLERRGIGVDQMRPEGDRESVLLRGSSDWSR
jgi:hypothetical protein